MLDWTIVNNPDTDLPPNDSRIYMIIDRKGGLHFAQTCFRDNGTFFEWYVRITVADNAHTFKHNDIIAFAPFALPENVQTAICTMDTHTPHGYVHVFLREDR